MELHPPPGQPLPPSSCVPPTHAQCQDWECSGIESLSAACSHAEDWAQHPVLLAAMQRTEPNTSAVWRLESGVRVSPQHPPTHRCGQLLGQQPPPSWLELPRPPAL